ncbi:MAG TPA: hypothetical protein VMV26_04035 [Alphaproteobacteria bacterium]|jgi:hypothetical protein|nr:hypothetical protein [Alphaproteobacteria bacterium]
MSGIGATLKPPGTACADRSGHAPAVAHRVDFTLAIAPPPGPLFMLIGADVARPTIMSCTCNAPRLFKDTASTADGHAEGAGRG